MINQEFVVNHQKSLVGEVDLVYEVIQNVGD